jgi:hypothetical protein
VLSEATAKFMWSSAKPFPTDKAVSLLGISSADHDDALGSVPSRCVRKPKRFVLWLDQSTPTVPLGSATTAAMSSRWMPLASVIGALKLRYGGSL